MQLRLLIVDVGTSEKVYKYIVDYIHTATTKKTTTIFIILIFFKSEWRAAYKFYCCLSCWHNTHAMSHILIHNLLYPTHTSTKIAAPYQLEIICVFYQEYLSLELYMCVSVSRSVVEPRVVMQKEKISIEKGVTTMCGDEKVTIWNEILGCQRRLGGKKILIYRIMKNKC